MAPHVQEIIHQLELGAGQRYLKVFVAVVAIISLAVIYNLTSFRNLANSEGMDAAQIARNLGAGRGFTTDFIRPLSIHLMQRPVREELAKLPPATDAASRAARQQEAQRLLRLENHPDLAHAPLYPALLALVLKVSPFGYPDTTTAADFKVYTPDLWIAMFNQLLLLVAAWQVFRLGRRLFDPQVGWVSAVVFVGTDLFWRFSLSGLSTLLLIVLVLALVSALASVELAARGTERTNGWYVRMALLAGALAGLCCLTRYTAGLLIFPVAGLLATLPGVGRPRVPAMLLAAAAFLVVVTPWVGRNLALSQTPFGTAGCAIFEETPLFPEHRLGRSMNPDVSDVTKRDLWQKFLTKGREVLENDLPKLGGNWVCGFFLAGLLVPFRNPALRRLRWFVAFGLVLLAIGQALGRTALSKESPEVNSENVLVALAPVVFLFGVSLLFILLDQLGAMAMSNRFALLVVFCVLASLPLVMSLLRPVPTTVVFPPYFPPWIQDKSSLVKEKDWLMTDFPWAVAWYGHRQALWLTLNYRDPADTRFRNDFFAVHDYLKPVRALYLSARMLQKVETDTLWDWLRRESSEKDWENFVRDWNGFVWVGVFLERQVPSGFPLKSSPREVLPELFLTESER